MFLCVLFYFWVALETSEIIEDGLAYIGWVVLFGFFAYVTGIRIAIRQKSGIMGSMWEDASAVISGVYNNFWRGVIFEKFLTRVSLNWVA